jgi:hypothetical protein
MNPGQAGIIGHGQSVGTASAASTSDIAIVDEDGNEVVDIQYQGAGANTTLRFPTPGTAGGGTRGSSQNLLIGPGEYIRFTSATALLNETLTVAIALLLSTPDIPLWDITGSVGGSALAVSTISEANTMQKVDLPW